MSTMQNTPFAQSETRRLLSQALLDEHRARQQYLRAAEQCDDQQLHVVAHTLRFTAAQEKEHAAIFQGLLRANGSEAPDLTASEETLIPEPVPLLLSLARQEHDEWDVRYPEAARIALEEGYPRISTAFLRIADTEHIHARRFVQFAEALQQGALFTDSGRTGWLCLPCGQMHYGTCAPDVCSTCGRDRGHFIRSSFEPFTVYP
ncbi:MAG: rubrerythrin family protein [Clostridia bacterium]|nr:rubrerythrin family protein [Clostridia bacterium]